MHSSPPLPELQWAARLEVVLKLSDQESGSDERVVVSMLEGVLGKAVGEMQSKLQLTTRDMGRQHQVKKPKYLTCIPHIHTSAHTSHTLCMPNNVHTVQRHVHMCVCAFFAHMCICAHVHMCVCTCVRVHCA